jgi:hypothetical protein
MDEDLALQMPLPEDFAMCSSIIKGNILKRVDNSGGDGGVRSCLRMRTGTYHLRPPERALTAPLTILKNQTVLSKLSDTLATMYHAMTGVRIDASL